MSKIVVNKPIVDINGDEMARVLWNKILQRSADQTEDIKVCYSTLRVHNGKNI